ncbi:MAG: MgtC/SapB family protein [Planctomycetota bacterium]|nr:MAG: MgtC/SapB family protein [Planctomycetota bacterium]REJ94963.1 MAG: MgtC/SapB family protein [Planctomycetota bacterium]REK20007.1 MAG: MgtC/SapB family protein [Planctomycetota bacterium]REK27574.1 MAG: MgtC/SapB family protein [Planctomycetota bacterium]
MDTSLDLDSFGLVCLAGVLGGAIGLEREIADKPAGLRTHIFVASGAALLVLLAEGAMDFFQQQNADRQIAADPIRVIQAIVVGISFLGAGTIVHHRGNQVEGLTTAASIFLTAGIGIAVAFDRIWLAVEVTGFALVVLVVVSFVQHRLLGKNPDAASVAGAEGDSE